MPETSHNFLATLNGAILQAGLDDLQSSSAAAVVANEFHSRLLQLGAVPAEFHATDVRLDGHVVPIAVGTEEADSPNSFALTNVAQRRLTEVRSMSRLFVYGLVGKPGAATIRAVGDSEIRSTLDGLMDFTSATLRGDFDGFDDDHPIVECVGRLRSAPNVTEVRFVLLVIGRSDSDLEQLADRDRLERLAGHLVGEPSISFDMWDCRRVDRDTGLDGRGGSITIDLKQFNYEPLECVEISHSGGQYRTFLAAFPGGLLADIYNYYNDRLLERNVRSFLQTRGKVNRGIQQTLTKEPDRFLAYNNGVTITAADVHVDGGRIHRLTDFQIVNGGQTTGSLHFAKYRADPRIDLSEVYVQAKISAVDLRSLPEFVAAVSRYSNSQNRVRESDLASSVPLHEEMHRRSIDTANTTLDGTRWFYERSRGEYVSEIERLRGANRERFLNRFPRAQLFTKLDLARSANCWDMKPEFACRGSEKSHLLFLERLRAQPKFEVTDDFFRRSVAKFILMKAIDEVVKDLDLGGYKSETVAHTYAVLRRLLLDAGLEIKLAKVWEYNEIGESTRHVIATLAPIVRNCLVRDAGRLNIAEWSKKSDAHAAIVKDPTVRRVPFKSVMKSEVGASSVDFGWATAAILDTLRATERPMTKAEIQRALGGATVLSDEEWNAARQFLVSTGQIEPRGQGSGRRYRLVV